MARIIGAIATSHTPTIGFAFDANKQNDPIWKPIFDAYEPIKAWLAEKKPDVMFVIYNDLMRLAIVQRGRLAGTHAAAAALAG